MMTESDHLPSPSHEGFSSSQLEAQPPKAREQVRKRLRKSMGGTAATAAAARRRSSAAAKAPAAKEESDDEEEDDDDEEEEQENRPPARAAPASSGRKKPTPQQQKAAAAEEASSDEEEEEEGMDPSPDAAWSPVGPRGSVAPTASASASASGKKKRGRPLKTALAAEEANDDEQEEGEKSVGEDEEEAPAAAAVVSAKKGGRARKSASPAVSAGAEEGDGGAMGRGSIWTCSCCTAANRARATVCEVCSYPRGTSPKEAAAKEKQREAKRKGEEGAQAKAKAKAKEEGGKGKPGKGKAMGEEKKEKKGPKPSAVVDAKKKKTPTKQARSSSTSGGGADVGAAKKAKKKGKGAEGAGSGKTEAAKEKKAKAAAKAAKPKPKQTPQEGRRASAASTATTAKGSSTKGAEEEEEVKGGLRLLLGCSGLEPAVKELVAKQARELGNALAARGSPQVKFTQTVDPSAPLTHLLVPADGREPRRTAKVLFALARGAHVVTTKWLADSVAAVQGKGDGKGDGKGQGEENDSTQAPGPLDESRYATERFPPRGALRQLLAGEGGPIYLAPTCVDPGEKVLGALVKECGGQLTKALKEAALVIAPQGPSTEEWMRETLGAATEAGSSGAAKAKAEALKTLLADHNCVTPVWLFDAIDAGVTMEDRSAFALAAPGTMPAAAAASAASAGGPANEENEAE